MKHIVPAACAAFVLCLTTTTAFAGPIERACLRSDRQAANRQVCACIQQVADSVLRGSDQRKAAAFFKNPDRAQKVRMSKSDADNDFWARYKAFGDQAEAYCGR